MPDSQHRHNEVSRDVIDAVAEVTATDPLDLEPPLFETIDPDALDALVANASTPRQIQFEYAGVQVTVEHTGAVWVVEPASGQNSSHRRTRDR